MNNGAGKFEDVWARQKITLYQAIGETALRNMRRYHNVELQVAMPSHTHALLKCRYAAAWRSGWRLARATGDRVVVVKHQLHRWGLLDLRCETVAYEEEREYCVPHERLDRLSTAVLVPSVVLAILKPHDLRCVMPRANVDQSMRESPWTSAELASHCAMGSCAPSSEIPLLTSIS